MLARTHFAAVAVVFATAAVSCGYGAKSKGEDPKTASDVKDEDSAADEGEDESMEEIDRYLEEEGEGSQSTESAPSDKGDGSKDEASDAPRQTPEERRNAIILLVKAKRESVANCYKMARQKNPKIGTKIAVTFVLKPDGKLKNEPVVDKGRTDIDDPEVVKCTVDVIKSIDFPAHPKGMETTFTYPFGF